MITEIKFADIQDINFTLIGGHPVHADRFFSAKTDANSRCWCYTKSGVLLAYLLWENGDILALCDQSLKVLPNEIALFAKSIGCAGVQCSLPTVYRFWGGMQYLTFVANELPTYIEQQQILFCDKDNAQFAIQDFVAVHVASGLIPAEAAQRAYDFFTHSIKNGECIAAAYQQNGEICATAAVNFASGSYGVICDVGVLPHCRGNFYSKQCVNYLLKRCADLNIKPICYCHQALAAYYRKLGFTQSDLNVYHFIFDKPPSIN